MKSLCKIIPSFISIYVWKYDRRSNNVKFEEMGNEIVLVLNLSSSNNLTKILYSKGVGYVVTQLLEEL